MKRSEVICLLLLGTGLVGYEISERSDEKTTVKLKRDFYATKAECIQDWGTEESCTEDNEGESRSGSESGDNNQSRRYNGPRYYWDRGSGHPVILTDSGLHQAAPSAHPNGVAFSHSLGVTDAGTVTRGGFGHFSSLGRGG
jgi:hypothetical protein